ncbi:MAG TPA: PH domain-containing protein [Candidatus Woesebacteria bacterium]|nr:PH domain-containing protein [Candidatus Woesebacteria bacterium]
MAEIFNSSEQIEEVPEIRDLEKKGQFKSILGALVVSPEKTSFESQDNDEKVILLGRKHFATNFGWIALACLAFFVPFFWGEFPMMKALTTNVNFMMSMAWYCFLLFYVIEKFLLWFYGVYIVTNERLVDVDFFGLLYKNINVTQINRIEDVNYSQKGILSSIFNFGNVVVQTASEQRSDDKTEGAAFSFVSVANPALVVKIISELMEVVDKNTERRRR